MAYTRREDRNAKRFVTLPKAVLDRWPIINRRVTIDLDTDLVVANEIVRGLPKSGLYRALPNGLNQKHNIFVTDPKVPAYMTLCMVDEDREIEYGEDGFAVPLVEDASSAIVQEEPHMIPHISHIPDRGKDRFFANSRYHLTTHTPFGPCCVGCVAKSSHKPHCKGTFSGRIIKESSTLTSWRFPN